MQVVECLQTPPHTGYTVPMSGAPVTLEGWYVLHEMYGIDWPRWNVLAPGEREQIVAEAAALLESQATPKDGHSAYWTLLSQSDLRLSLARDLGVAGRGSHLSRTLRNYLTPTYSTCRWSSSARTAGGAYSCRASGRGLTRIGQWAESSGR